MSAIEGHKIPTIPRGVRLHEDKVRGMWVLLAPERTITLDPIGLAILTALDGKRSFEDVVNDLATQYDAPVDQVRGDVADFVTGLANRRILELV